MCQTAPMPAKTPLPISPTDRSRNRTANAGQRRAFAANTFARLMAPLFAELEASGFLSPYAMAAELNRRGLRGRLGTRWVPAAVNKLRLRMIGLGVLNSVAAVSGRGVRYYLQEPTRHSRAAVDRNREALREQADAFARRMRPALALLRARGITTYAKLADALNACGFEPRRGRSWTASSVKNLCARLDQLAEREPGRTSLAV